MMIKPTLYFRLNATYCSFGEMTSTANAWKCLSLMCNESVIRRECSVVIPGVLRAQWRPGCGRGAVLQTQRRKPMILGQRL